MKKKLNEIFDEVKPQELDQFSDELMAPELSDKALASVKGKVYAKTNLNKTRKPNPKEWLRFGAIAACFVLILSTVIVVPMLREDNPGLGITSDSDLNHTKNPNGNGPIQDEHSYNDGITISASLSQILAESDKDEPISVKLQAIDLLDVYASNYADRLYDGKTYDEWWAEYEVYSNRMIEIDAQLKRGPNTELENEYNILAENAEALTAYMSQIQKEQKAESVNEELKWLKSLGIEAEYKKGYFIFSASSETIKKLANGKCDYYIDIENDTQEPVEEMH